MDRSSLKTVLSQGWMLAGGREIRCDGRPLVMGIVNVTPDSFYDGGRYLTAVRAVSHALDLVGQGADILDIGAESTRPGAQPVGEEEELARLLPVMRELARRVTVPISVDTTKAEVARAALEEGASIINDVSALRHDPDMASVIARYGAGLVLMHMQGTPPSMQDGPEYDDVVAEVTHFLEERMETAVRAGIAKKNIVLDPGIGFGKLLRHNLDLLNRLSCFMMFNRPLLVGVSRKGFIGQLVDRSVEEREWGTAAAVALAVDRGAQILRVHDVAAMADVVRVAAAVRSCESSSGQEGYA